MALTDADAVARRQAGRQVHPDPVYERAVGRSGILDLEHASEGTNNRVASRNLGVGNEDVGVLAPDYGVGFDIEPAAFDRSVPADQTRHWPLILHDSNEEEGENKQQLRRKINPRAA